MAHEPARWDRGALDLRHFVTLWQKVFVETHYQGDVARLFAGAHLLDDNYYNGQTGTIGLRHFAREHNRSLTLDVLLLHGDSPIYIQSPYRAGMSKAVR